MSKNSSLLVSRYIVLCLFTSIKLPYSISRKYVYVSSLAVLRIDFSTVYFLQLRENT